MFSQRADTLTCILVVTAALLVAIAKCATCTTPRFP
jgi:hypothetical protein